MLPQLLKTIKMTLKEFKNYIESFQNSAKFKYGISDPFSWRGSYSEVAFEVLETPMEKEVILERINKAYSETFIGYKGGEFQYYDYTDVNFEVDHGSYTDGEYCAEMISKIENERQYASQEERLIKKAFNV